MKVRKAFVSNSSTCSFLIYGVEITDEIGEDLEKLKFWLEDYLKERKDRAAKKGNVKLKAAYEADLESVKNDEEEYNTHELLMEYRDNILRYKSPGLEYYSGIDNDCYLGISPKSSNDKETFGEFKQKIKKRVWNLFPDIPEEDFDWIERAWENR